MGGVYNILGGIDKRGCMLNNERQCVQKEEVCSFFEDGSIYCIYTLKLGHTNDCINNLSRNQKSAMKGL